MRLLCFLCYQFITILSTVTYRKCVLNFVIKYIIDCLNIVYAIMYIPVVLLTYNMSYQKEHRDIMT